ncbi:MAG: sugar phosphate isomerase/epimerase [Candidatus Eremiobacteraeota bacterium]|nr:sugar phosphate isomerase/epimerase [Candidatus Eremiobacteraeota bacterium]
MKEYRFGVSEFTTWPWSFERDVERYAAHGVDAIEVCEFKLNRNDYAPQLESISGSGLEVSSVQTTVHSIFPDSLAPTPLEPTDRLAQMVSAMERIAPHVPPKTPFVVITGAAPRGDCDHVCEYAIEAFHRLADVAASFDMRVAFEPLNPILFNTDTALWGLDNALSFIERIDRPNVGLCVDTWNIFETPDLPHVIKRCGEKIFLVQVSDWRTPRSNADRRSLGDGEIPTPQLLAALRSAGYVRPYVLEIFSSDFLPDSLWKADMDDVIDRNIGGFAAAWNAGGIPV